MYETPELECYGTFRELTKGGGITPTDTFGIQDNAGCLPNPPPQGGGYCLSFP
jgi:hypothetical protein